MIIQKSLSLTPVSWSERENHRTKHDNEMNYTDYSQELETMRLEGKDCLSWIERFGIYLLERNLYESEPEKCENILVIRMKDNLFNAYYCYFYTNHEGKTQFMVQAHEEKVDNVLLSKLLDDSHWDLEVNRKWWSEVFANNDMSLVDDSLIENDMVHVSDDSTMKMVEFLDLISERLEQGMIKLWHGRSHSVSKIYLAGDYATVQPISYSLSRKYGCDVCMFNADQTTEFYNDELTTRDAVQWFYIPWKFRNLQLNISPAMTLEQVSTTNGISIPLPVIVTDTNTKKIESVQLTDKPISGYEELSWEDLITNDNRADIQLDDYFFKEIMLCVIPDGYGTYYLGNKNDRKCRIKQKQDMLWTIIKKR